MARYTQNAVEGKADESRSGWRSRREKARKKRSGREMTRAEIAAARRAHAGAAQDGAEHGFNPEVQTTAPAPDDFVAALSDADLAALYKQLHDGRAHPPKSKRPAIERAVRAKQAEQAELAAANCDEQGEEELIEGEASE